MKLKKVFFVAVTLIAGVVVSGSNVTAEPGASIVNIRPTASSLAVGYQHACALNTFGQAFCWGDNSDGQLGNGTFASSYTAVPVTNGRDFIAISVGFNSTCALSVYKTVWCWGDNYEGQLGNGLKGSGTDSATPVRVVGIDSAIAIGVGSFAACALLENHSVWCWGDNYDGQLGNGTSSDSSVPTQVSNLPDVASISIRNRHGCAILRDATVRCWGSGGAGQLGNNTMNSKSILPVPVSNLSGVLGVTTTSDGSCAITSTQGIACWGTNSDYQNGHNRNRGLNLIPEENQFVAGAQAIGLGYSHACVLKSDSSVQCWGDNFFGQRAESNLNIADSYVPAQVSGLTNVAALVTGSYSNCVILTDGIVKCWGSNYRGKLGNGNNADSPLPVTVQGISGVVGASTATTTTTTTTTTTLPKITTSFTPTTNYVASLPVATIATKPTLSTKKTLSAKSLATYTGLKIVRGSTVSVTVNATSRKTCRVSGTTLKAIKTGTCKVVVTVKNRTGKKTSRNLTLNVRR